ncbi:hypothetical protein OSG_eHP40_00020 [environmental Halophage eHP-40]|nr:hypothetical protein OSG_eHP40_00020 [environmental Halophage eHP-40]
MAIARSRKKQALLDDAKRELETMYRGDTARFPTLQGDEQVFIKNLAAHKWDAEGGEPTSSNQTGGSTSYSTGSTEDYSHSLWHNVQEAY